MRVLRRYWWLLLIGVVIGEIVAVVGARAKSVPASWTAESTVLVTSSSATYYRTDPQIEVPGGAGVNTDSTNAALVQAANLYPLLIQSDRIVTLREEMFGHTAGQIQARAIFAAETSVGFRASSIPVIQIDAASPSKAAALRLSDQTVAAFQRYIEGQQTAAKVAPRERVRVQKLTAAQVIDTNGGTSYGLAGLLGLAIVIAFGGLAFMLDAAAVRARGTVSDPASTDRV
jgi:hypothetical protein